MLRQIEVLEQEKNRLEQDLGSLEQSVQKLVETNREQQKEIEQVR